MSDSSDSRSIPAAIIALADARQAARDARDWHEADRFRAEIEGAGWKVVDQATSYRLSAAHPPTLVEAGRTVYGASSDVPSHVDEAPIGVASIVLRPGARPEDLSHVPGLVAGHAPDGTQLIIVAEDVSPDMAERLADLDAVDPGAPGVATEVVWLTSGLGYATALNAAIRRALAAVVIVLDASLEPSGDFVTPLVRALDDQAVGVTGAFGLRSRDLRHFDATAAGVVDAIDGRVLAFRRSDYAERGPLDEKFRLARYLDIWWSLVLRDEGEGHDPRRALALDLPIAGHESGDHEPGDHETSGASERDRLTKRNFYRVIDRFGGRRDLLLASAPNDRSGSDETGGRASAGG